MRLSTRNQLTGTVTEVNLEAVMATVKVRLDGGEQIVTSSITKEAVEELSLAVGTLPLCWSSPPRSCSASTDPLSAV